MNMIAIGNLNGLDEIYNILEQYTAHMNNRNKKESIKLLFDWYDESIKLNNNKGFLIINPDCAFGQGMF